MAGIYLKNDDVFKALSDWLDSSIRLKGESHPLTTHVSSFIKSDLSKEHLLEYSINVFLELVNCTDEKKHADELMPMLVIPLGCSDDLCLWDGSIPLSSQFSDEPPSVYLFQREKSKYLERAEEYKIPVDLDLAELKSEKFNIYYRCFRDSTAIDNGWEFNKAIYIEYYPANFLF